MKFKHKKHSNCILKTNDVKIKFVNGEVETSDKNLIKVLQENPDVEEVKLEPNKSKA